MSGERTGIEVRIDLNDATKAVGKVLHLLHLDALSALAAQGTTLVVVVDGAEHSQPFSAAHFVECAPGSREVSVWCYGIGPFAKAAGPGQSQADLRVSVEPGKVTRLLYKIHNFTGTDLLLDEADAQGPSGEAPR